MALLWSLGSGELVGGWDVGDLNMFLVGGYAVGQRPALREMGLIVRVGWFVPPSLTRTGTSQRDVPTNGWEVKG